MKFKNLYFGEKSVPRDKSIGFYVQISDNKSDGTVYAWK